MKIPEVRTSDIMISDVGIRELNIPPIRTVFDGTAPLVPAAPPVVLEVGLPVVDIPGCVEAHEKSDKNENLLEDDPKGTKTFCDGQTPSFDPIQYEPERLVPTNIAPVPKTESPEKPAPEVPKAPEIKPPPEKPATVELIPEVPAPEPEIPWVEKYRPSSFDDIVLDKINQSIFCNILEKQYFPNMLFYGPPGTGKTTTIINLINTYYQNLGIKKYSSNVIHLNASDERGIDIIRNQIFQFVNSQNIYVKGIKFVILDEVDYMTKNAQQALKYLLQTCFENVRFCLICNYISKIDYSLKNEFLCIRFNQLPASQIQKFLKTIAGYMVQSGLVLVQTV